MKKSDNGDSLVALTSDIRLISLVSGVQISSKVLPVVTTGLKTFPRCQLSFQIGLNSLDVYKTNFVALKIKACFPSEPWRSTKNNTVFARRLNQKPCLKSRCLPCGRFATHSLRLQIRPIYTTEERVSHNFFGIVGAAAQPLTRLLD